MILHNIPRIKSHRILCTKITCYLSEYYHGNHIELVKVQGLVASQLNLVQHGLWSVTMLTIYTCTNGRDAATSSKYQVAGPRHVTSWAFTTASRCPFTLPFFNNYQAASTFREHWWYPRQAENGKAQSNDASSRRQHLKRPSVKPSPNFDRACKRNSRHARVIV